MSLIRYIYGRQINLIYDKLYNNKNNDIFPLLMFISNNATIKKDDYLYKIDEEKNIYKNINSYIKKILSNNNLSYDNIINKNRIIKKDGESEFSGIYYFQADKINNTLQKNILQIYKYLTNSNPHAQFILLCNKETSNEELTAFLYRALLCESNSCFIIAGIELLQFQQKTIFQNIIDELYTKNYNEKEKKMKSCLIIAYVDNEADIIKGIFNLKGKKSLKNLLKVIENQIMEYKDSKVEIVQSDRAGVGKSTYIKSKIKESGREYIYFPLGGVFTRKDVLTRLKELNKIKNLTKGTLHLDLYDTEQIDLTMDFLFSIIITKIYGQNEDIFYLPNDVEIMIEIPNGFVDYLRKFPLLDSFKKTYLELDKLAPLIVEKKLDTNVQIVANYLKIIKRDINLINQNDLHLPEINDNLIFANREHLIEGEILSQDECQSLIFNKIKENRNIRKPNYYQITSFINVLGTQLKKFSQNNFLSSENLRTVGQERKRSFIITNFIKFTNYFTEGGFIDLVNNQMRSYLQFNRNFDEEKDNEEAIKNLANVGQKNNLVSFDQIDSSLLFFQEGNGEGFTFISNLKNQEDYQNYLDLMRTQDNNYNIPILNNNDQQEIFLEQLKIVLGINNILGIKFKKFNKKSRERR